MQTLESIYEYFGSTLCVKRPALLDYNVVTPSQYNNYVDRGHFNVLRPGKGKDNYALIEFESITKQEVKSKIIALENPNKPLSEFNILSQYIKPDNKAISFFAEYEKPSGEHYKFEEQVVFTTNAIILNACYQFYKLNAFRRKKTKLMQELSEAVNRLAELEQNGTPKYKFNLPTNYRRFQETFEKYMDKGYPSLIHGNEGNANSKKVNEMIERLILSIYSMKNKPFATTVQQIYLQFLGGGVDIVDSETGELFNPEDFYKKGKPIIISDGTVWRILNDPENRKIVDKYRSGSLEHNNIHRPHHHRNAPKWSLSKVSLDDRDLPRKMSDGKRVKAYYAYDVASGCVIGASYSKDKDTKLFIDCIKDMMYFLKENDLGVPMEMEVEHHLVNQFREDLMKAGTVFPFVRWCNAGNSQEKHAEHFNKAKKYGYEKTYQDGIGRWYAKSEAHRTIVEKVFDSENNNYKEKKYEYNQLVADDKEIIMKYNYDLHPNQKQYKGMTRMDVLKSKLNPELAKFNEVVWARYIGEKVTVTIKRSQYVRVQYADYQLPSHRVMKLLAPNNYTVDAYYLKNNQGEIGSVYLYQNDQYICEATKIIKYNTAIAEHTEADREAYLNQSKYVSEFDADMKQGKKKISKLVLIENKYPTQIEPEIVKEELVQDIEVQQEDEFANILASYDAEYIKDKAKYNI